LRRSEASSFLADKNFVVLQLARGYGFRPALRHAGVAITHGITSPCWSERRWEGWDRGARRGERRGEGRGGRRCQGGSWGVCGVWEV
jgi:hypothetical protein